MTAAPITTIDRRFSAPDAEPTPWSTTERLLHEAQLSWISTVRADGRPHVTPLVAVWLDGALYFTTGSGEQKHRNLRANPHVVVTTGAASWESGIDVIVEGTAERATDAAELQRVADEYHRKWDGEFWDYTVLDGRLAQGGPGGAAAVSDVFRVRPSKIFAHAKGSFGQTRYVFP